MFRAGRDERPARDRGAADRLWVGPRLRMVGEPLRDDKSRGAPAARHRRSRRIGISHFVSKRKPLSCLADRTRRREEAPIQVDARSFRTQGGTGIASHLASRDGLLQHGRKGLCPPGHRPLPKRRCKCRFVVERPEQLSTGVPAGTTEHPGQDGGSSDRSTRSRPRHARLRRPAARRRHVLVAPGHPGRWSVGAGGLARCRGRAPRPRRRRDLAARPAE
jgi:hypothetical protein